ncbi:carbohydrate ABC transporter permease [Paenibacillus nasutitermitis]|uniref:Sugar ABC transporter permease n=1 Tax=Paenibacillus nasutitermitis TaxID=1652958 RepID=A0A916Z7B6_9BACL|nr:sugar ABC transporter permease [Paenibacillus nasutitermitis]GGD77916.1 sugar ABC transporter permease [Paenibacillus nasutitermitis]
MRYSQKIERHLGKILVAPALIGLSFVVVYPLITNILMGFQDMNMTQPDSSGWVGFDNYRQLFADPIFRKAISNTLIWTVLGVILQLMVAVPLSLLLNIEFKGMGFYRGALLIPWVMPSVVAAFTWVWMYDGSFGIINYFLMELNFISEPVIWLGNPDTALYAVLAEQVWKGFPFPMIMLLAALQAIPKDIYEAANVDGATALQKIFRITIPQILPSLALCTVFITIWTFNSFENIWLMTEGGPLNSSETLTTYVYRVAFQSFDLGVASSSALVMFALLSVVIILYARYISKQEAG